MHVCVYLCIYFYPTNITVTLSATDDGAKAMSNNKGNDRHGQRRVPSYLGAVGSSKAGSTPDFPQLFTGHGGIRKKSFQSLRRTLIMHRSIRPVERCFLLFVSEISKLPLMVRSEKAHAAP